MKVHLVDRSGSSVELECKHFEEGENGIYLYDDRRPGSQNLKGYVPYDRLDYIDS